MHTRLTLCKALLCTLVFSFHANAQHLKIKNYSLGYKIRQVDATGTAPITVAPLLQDPVPYLQFINNVHSNSMTGFPGPQTVHTFYLNAEWYKPESASRFWKKHTIQGGIFFTNLMSRSKGSIGDEYTDRNDGSHHINVFAISQSIEFFGLDAGINRLFPVSHKLQFIVGLRAQAGLALTHRFQQEFDTSSFTRTNGWVSKTTTLPSLKGQKYFQTMVMLPVGIEYKLLQSAFLIRLELEPAIVGDKYRKGKGAALKEAHGAGIMLIYQPERR